MSMSMLFSKAKVIIIVHILRQISDTCRRADQKLIYAIYSDVNSGGDRLYLQNMFRSVTNQLIAFK